MTHKLILRSRRSSRSSDSSSGSRSSSGSSRDRRSNRQNLPVGGRAALRAAEKGDAIDEHPAWAQASLSDLAVDRVSIRNKANVSVNFFTKQGVAGLGWGQRVAR